MRDGDDARLQTFLDMNHESFQTHLLEDSVETQHDNIHPHHDNIEHTGAAREALKTSGGNIQDRQIASFMRRVLPMNQKQHGRAVSAFMHAQQTRGALFYPQSLWVIERSR